MFRFLSALSLAALLALPGAGQAPAPTQPEQSQAADTAPTAPVVTPHTPQGEVLFQSHGTPPEEGSDPSRIRLSAPSRTGTASAQGAPVDVSDAERGAVEVLSYDLDARLKPETSGLVLRAGLVVRNRGTAPLRQVALQISSTLRWESVSLVAAGKRVPLPLAQHQLETDADHTGAATEAVLTLPEPLAPGASATLDAFYSGTVGQSGGRLAQLGASTSQQQQADWDAISPDWTGLRGFGNVLWYPVASPQLFLHEGNTLFVAVAQMRQADVLTRVRLRLSVEYRGEPPVAAYFCGRRGAFTAVPDDPAMPTATGAGIARTEFPAAPVGFRLPSLFVLREAEVLLGNSSAAAPAPPAATSSSSSSSIGDTPAPPPSPVAQPTDQPFLALVSGDPGVGEGLAQAGVQGAALLAPWLGPHPLSALTVLDHAGQPYQDGPLLVAPAATLQTSPERPALVYSLTHAWIDTGQPWMDEGLAQFFALLWVERDRGRPAALAALQDLLQPVALAEPNLSSAADKPGSNPLIHTAEELFYRRKAAAVWWMLRDLAGEEALRASLTAWRTQPASSQPAAAQALALEHLLEQRSGKDLGWFFREWVLEDRGLPDLSIAGVELSQTPAGAGHASGWLLAVTVRNEGGATADVPVAVHSRALVTSARMRVPPFSQVTQRIVAETMPTAVTVNDGSVPELRTGTHQRAVDPPQTPQH